MPGFGIGRVLKSLWPVCNISPYIRLATRQASRLDSAMVCHPDLFAVSCELDFHLHSIFQADQASDSSTLCIRCSALAGRIANSGDGTCTD
jgi:hypothetical protein